MAATPLTRTVESRLAPSPVDVAHLPPSDVPDRAPLILWLHGGGGDSGFLDTCRPVFERAWDAGSLPPMHVVTPSAERGGYLDLPGGPQWESFVLDELVGHAVATLRCADERDLTFVGGISMGRVGALRLAFKRADRFGAVLALEPAIEEAVRWTDVSRRDQVTRPAEQIEEWYGNPVDPAAWEVNSPSALMLAHAPRIVASGLGIFLVVGDEDQLHLDRCAELLHRLMNDRAVPHEYRLVRWANHSGPSMPGRIDTALGFLRRHLARPNVVADLDESRVAGRVMADEHGYRRSRSVEVGGGGATAHVLGHKFGNRVARMTATDHPLAARPQIVTTLRRFNLPRSTAGRSRRSVCARSDRSSPRLRSSRCGIPTRSHHRIRRTVRPR
jgi:S-formylglutathione hydrolase